MKLYIFVVIVVLSQEFCSGQVVDQCQTLGEAFIAACDVSGEATVGTTCPDGCMAAFLSFQEACNATDQTWNETIPSGMSGLMEDNFGIDFGSTESDANWADSWWTGAEYIPASLDLYVTFLSLSQRLHDRCEWPGFYGSCGYHYSMAIETAGQPPGEHLQYNCSVLADREVCSSECQNILDMAISSCGPSDTYTSMGLGITTDYNGMMAALHLQSACYNDFVCSPSSIGESFCATLTSMYEGTNIVLVTLGCSSSISFASALLAANEVFEDVIPYRASTCLESLTADYGSALVQDVCYCTDVPCPTDTRPHDTSTCAATDGIYQWSAPEPAPAPPAPPATAPAASGALTSTFAFAFLTVAYLLHIAC